MSAKPAYFKLGLFIILFVALVVASILFIGMDEFFRTKLRMETYLNESVHGLDVGSVVKYRGVGVGVVESISFTATRYEASKPLKDRFRYVRLVVALNPKSLPAEIAGRFAVALHEEVESRGLRVRLNLLGLTGKTYVEMDYSDPLAERLPIDWVPEYPYVPSERSFISEVFTSVEEVMRNLARVDLPSMATNLNSLLTMVRETVGELRFSQLSTNADGLVTELRQSNATLQGLLKLPEWAAAATNSAALFARLRMVTDSEAIPLLLDQLQRTLIRIDQTLSLQEGNLDRTMDNLRVMSGNLRELSENAKRYPAHVLFGEPPKRVLESK